MNLGLKRNVVRVVPYTNEWNNEFMRIRDEIQKPITIKRKLKNN